MNVRELIEKLQKAPQDLPIRVELIDENIEDNAWVYDLQVCQTGQSGYEVSGEVIIIASI
tara:strand:+ start:248 stop:427 length:180 start_codon:yes stop_codon:yes gene_type:complete